MHIKCDECGENPAEFAVGVQDHLLVCEPCLDWGDHKRKWNLEPRQRLSPKFAVKVDPYTFGVTYG